MDPPPAPPPQPLLALHQDSTQALALVLTQALAAVLTQAPRDAVSGITVLLSLTVFMLLVAEIMPATSDSVPLIGERGGLRLGTGARKALGMS